MSLSAFALSTRKLNRILNQVEENWASGDYQAAVDLLEEINLSRLKSKSTKRLRVLFHLGKSYNGLGRVQLTVQYLEEVVDAGPSRYIGEAALILGRLYRKQGRCRKATERYSLALEHGDRTMNPHSVYELHLAMGECYGNQGLKNSAEAEFRKALEIPIPAIEKASLWLQMGKLLINKDESSFTDGYENLLLAVQYGSEEERIESYKSLARAFAEKRRLEQALHFLKCRLDRSDADEEKKTREIQFALYYFREPEKLIGEISRPGRSRLSFEIGLHVIRLYIEQKELEKAFELLNGIDGAFSAEPYFDGSKLESLKCSITAIKNRQSRKIACILPLTGKFAHYGNQALQAVKLAAEVIKEERDASFELVIADSKGSPDSVAELAEKMILEDGAIAFIGPLFAKSVENLAPVVTRYKTPAITPGAGSRRVPTLSPYIFRNAQTNEMQCKSLVKYAVEILGLSTFATLYPREAFAMNLAAAFKHEVEIAGGTVLQELSYSSNETNFRTPLEILKKHELRQGKWEPKDYAYGWLPPIAMKFDAIFIPDYPEVAGQIAGQLRFYGIENVILMGWSGWNSPQLVKVGGAEIRGCLFVDGFFEKSKRLKSQKFSEAFRGKFGSAPNILSAQAYDAATMLMSVIADGNDDGESIRKALSRIRDFEGVCGQISMGPDGDAARDLFVLTVSDGEITAIEEIEPAPAASPTPVSTLTE